MTALPASLACTIARRHGVGVLRNPRLRREPNTGMDKLQILKNGLDPKTRLSLDMMALHGAEGALRIEHGVEVEARQ